MKRTSLEKAAELRVIRKYHKLYAPLIELVEALQALEPGGTLVDDVVLTSKAGTERVRVAYTAHPIMLTIQDKDRAFILRVVGTPLP